MPGKGEFSDFFQRMLENPAAVIAALQADTAAFEEEIVRSEGGRHLARAILPIRSAFGFAVFDKNGEAIRLDAPAWMPRLENRETLFQHVDPRSPNGRLLCLPGKDRQPMFGIWAPWSETQGWNIPASIRQVAEAHKATTVALFASDAADRIEVAAASFGLPPSLQRVVAAVTRTGNVKEAASLLGISYVSAREAIAEATRRMNLPNSAALVRAVTAAGFGILPSEISSSLVLADTLNISERQARVALLISTGSSREAAAKALGVSNAVIGKDLKALYAILGVVSAAELARLITEMQALHLFARATDNPTGFLDPAIEPSRYSVRPQSRELIAWSDYGPASGRPVLIVHSNWSCRAVPLPLLRALQARGWRPIAIDRPGFGATDLGLSSREDPFSQAIADTLQVLRELRLERIPVIARCGGQFVHAFASRHPEKLGPVILVSPTPRASESGKRSGPVGAFKEAFFRSPRLVELLFRVISAQFSFERVEQLMRTITEGSPTDTALCEDPQFIRDRFRALRPFACGGYMGGVLEELIVSHGGWDFAPIPSKHWTILQGDEDYHNDLDEVVSYWGPLLPDATIELVQGAGRFMPSSHPKLVVDRLEEALLVKSGK